MLPSDAGPFIPGWHDHDPRIFQLLIRPGSAGMSVLLGVIIQIVLTACLKTVLGQQLVGCRSP
jgi:hypothetical protein